MLPLQQSAPATGCGRRLSIVVSGTTRDDGIPTAAPGGTIKEWPNVELAQFWYLKSVSEAGSLGAAARRCGVPQATLVRAVTDLERELHVAILRRTGTRVALTPFGTRLIDHIDVILYGVAAIRRAADSNVLRDHRDS